MNNQWIYDLSAVGNHNLHNRLTIVKAAAGLVAEYYEFFNAPKGDMYDELADVYFWLTALYHGVNQEEYNYPVYYVTGPKAVNPATVITVIDLCEKLTRTDSVRSKTKKSKDREKLNGILNTLFCWCRFTAARLSGDEMTDAIPNLHSYLYAKLNNRHHDILDSTEQQAQNLGTRSPSIE